MDDLLKALREEAKGFGQVAQLCSYDAIMNTKQLIMDQGDESRKHQEIIVGHFDQSRNEFQDFRDDFKLAAGCVNRKVKLISNEVSQLRRVLASFLSSNVRTDYKTQYVKGPTLPLRRAVSEANLVQDYLAAKDDLLSDFDYESSVMRNDIEASLETIWALPRSDQDRAVAVMQSPKLHSWITESSSSALLVNFNDPKKTSSTSFISAKLTYSIQSDVIGPHNPRNIFALLFLCAEHIRPDYGVSGMLRNLIGQLLIAYPDFGMSVIKQIQRADQQDISSLCQIFHRMISQLPPHVTVFCVLDAITVYEQNSSLCEEGAFAVQELMDMVQWTKDHGCDFKVLLTSAWNSHIFYKYVPDRQKDIIWMPAKVPPQGGFTRMKWNSSVGSGVGMLASPRSFTEMNCVGVVQSTDFPPLVPADTKLPTQTSSHCSSTGLVFTMSASTVFERRNKQIQDAIDGQNLKQALQLCEKRLKKGEDSHFLRAWKAHILLSHGDDVHRQRGISEALALCRMEPPVSDIEALNMLYSTLKTIDEHAETARAIWEKAAKAKPQALDIQLKWFNMASEMGDWKTAQKAAMSLQNNFPKERKYYFWAILMCYLITIDPANSEIDGKLFGTLAYRMILKAASSVPTDPKELLSPARAIQTSEELFLLIKILETQGRHEEIVSLLNSKHLGIESRIAQKDWAFVSAKIVGLENAGLWDEAISFTRELLALPDDLTNGSTTAAVQEKDDWQVWSLLLAATKKLGKKEAPRETQDFIAAYIKRQPKSRNAQLAALDLTEQRITMNELPLEDLLPACKEYFNRNCTKLYCFHDLRKYLIKLDRSMQDEFQIYASQKVVADQSADDQKQVTDPFKGVAAINALKFEYCFQLSLKGDEKPSVQKVENFVSRCLRIYRSTERPNQSAAPSTIESQPSDDLCLLAVMALIRLHETNNESKPDVAPHAALVQAAALIENLLLKSPCNYEALLLLVRIYLLLGAGSLALKSFHKLSVKQMQYETVAHNLFTRLGSTHPHAAPPYEGLEPKDYDPQTAMRQALSFYRNSEIATTYSRNVGLEHGSYVNVAGSIELQKSLKNSICRRMWALETRRIQRLVGGDPVGQYDHIVSDTDPVVDKRNFDGFMNCEAPGTLSFEEHVRLGPKPGAHAVKAMTITDVLFSYLKSNTSTKKASSSSHPVSPNINLSRYLNPEFDLPLLETELTPAEIENVNIHLTLLKALASLSAATNTKQSSPPAPLTTHLATLESFLTKKLTALSATPLPTSILLTTIPLTPPSKQQPSATSSIAPSWLYLHTTISLLETLKATTFFLTYLSPSSSTAKTKSKVPTTTTKEALPNKETLENLHTLVKQLIDAIRRNTRFLKMQIAESGMLGELVEWVTGGYGFEKDTVKNGDGDGEEEGAVKREIEEMMDTASLELFCGSLMESWDEALDGVLGLCASM
ncbi:cytoskeleton organization protein [Blastomyces gilchristii SLH14081]|uniref:Cytoskeleton organization protein n=1 Tax=Blastomyces gilchristii (strain SLH14081) TaxID=559298 RepID=A0A179UDR4_BLAGS|nr:cytoskeleton organization protein [Blastomyces gilchristii SLH14081]OAT05409.1 cytoskeleton organization protein [Blastomyces gilchristii SLH14081]